MQMTAHGVHKYVFSELWDWALADMIERNTLRLVEYLRTHKLSWSDRGGLWGAPWTCFLKGACQPGFNPDSLSQIVESWWGRSKKVAGKRLSGLSVGEASERLREVIQSILVCRKWVEPDAESAGGWRVATAVDGKPWCYDRPHW